MRLVRVAAALCAALAWFGCRDTTASASPYVVLAPVLDSLLVGDQVLAPSVTYYDGVGNARIPGRTEVSWTSSDPAILGVDSATGRMTGRRRGVAIILATVQSARGAALIAVSNTLDLTLLLDTIYAMPGDTLTVAVAVQKQSQPAPVVWYEAPPSASGVYAIDSASGRLSALAEGGPVPYIVHADTIADTGAVSVLRLSDTTGGKFFYSVLGTVVTHVGGGIRAVNYARTDGRLAFQLQGEHVSGVATNQTVQITLPDSVVGPAAYAIDSMSPGEAVSGQTLICTPPRPWALWSSQSPQIIAYTRPSGTLGVTQIVLVAHGQTISGRFAYRAQRADLYADPLGVLTIRGTFVAPLVTDRTTCK